MTAYLKSLAIVLPTVLVLDGVWLGLLAPKFYDRELGSLARRDVSGAIAPRWPAALLVWGLIPAALVLFVKPHLGAESTVLHAFGWGAAFGFALYGVYDFTNYAMLQSWSLRMTLVDLVWGSFLCGTAAAVMKLAEPIVGK